MATLQDPSVVIELVPGAAAIHPGAHAVAILKITIPEPPAPPILEILGLYEPATPPPPPPLLTVPVPPVPQLA